MSARLLAPEAASTAIQDRHSESGTVDNVANGRFRAPAREIMERPSVAFEVGFDGVLDAGKRSGMRRTHGGEAAHRRKNGER
jgi:hypothetical protein